MWALRLLGPVISLIFGEDEILYAVSRASS